MCEEPKSASSRLRSTSPHASVVFLFRMEEIKRTMEGAGLKYSVTLQASSP